MRDADHFGLKNFRGFRGAKLYKEKNTTLKK